VGPWGLKKKPAISYGACVISNSLLNLFISITCPANFIATLGTKPIH
jgi:hypothetical protein